MKRLMDIFVERLNDNEAGQVFKGNFLFQFASDADRFEIISNSTHTLVKDITQYSPVMQTMAEAVMFTDKTKRIDWQCEYLIAIRVEGDEYTDESAPAYQVIRQACASLNTGFGDEVIEKYDRRYVFNAQPPKKIGYFERGAESYILLSCVMTVTETMGALYGQDTVILMDNNEIDVISLRKIAVTRLYTADEKVGLVNDFHLPIGRHMMLSVEMNLLDDELYDDITGKNELDKNYELKIDDDVYAVSMQSATEVIAPNKVRTLELEYVEVRHGEI